MNLRISLSLIFLLSCVACNESQQKQRDALQEDLKRQILELSKTAKDSAPKIDLNLSVEEVKKLTRFEYGVFSLPESASAEELSTKLGKLGEERWDCFHLEKRTTLSIQGEPSSEYLIFCKRRPDSLLQYVPKGLVGGLFGLMHN